jgi:hypothetical protein
MNLKNLLLNEIKTKNSKKTGVVTLQVEFSYELKEGLTLEDVKKDLYYSVESSVKHISEMSSNGYTFRFKDCKIIEK